MTDPDTPQPAGPTPRGRAPRWMRFALVGSLAANLLVVGLVAGAAIGRHGHDRDHMPPRDAASAIYLRALAPEQRAAFAERLRAEVPRLTANRAARTREARAVLELLRAEPFDARALAASLSRQRAALLRGVGAGDALFVDHLASMTHDERLAYAARLEEMLNRVRRDRPDRPDRPDRRD